MAELAGKDTGLCRGRGGSMHIVDVGRRLMTATGIVGGTIPLALGTALVAREDGNVVAVYFGDGASNTGSFHECLNMASLWKLPVVLVCENNGYAEFTPMSAHTVVSHVSVHGQPYGIPSQIVDGNDTLAVLEAARAAVARARDGGGPTIVECLTYRLRGHYVGDPAAYRKAEEVAEWRDKDPIRRFAGTLMDRKTVTQQGGRSDGGRRPGARRGRRALHDGKSLARIGLGGGLRLCVNEPSHDRNPLHRRPAPGDRAGDGAGRNASSCSARTWRSAARSGSPPGSPNNSASGASSTRRSARTASWGWRPAPPSPASGRSSRSCSSISSRWR